MTPQPSSRVPNPALTPLPPITPIVSSSLSELRAARTGAESGGGITSSKGASKSSKDDDGKTSTELVTEAISKRFNGIMHQSSHCCETATASCSGSCLCNDIRQPEKQMALRADLQKTKFTIEMSCLQMLKTMLDALSLWEKIGDNDRDSYIKLNSFYTLLLEKWPTQPVEECSTRALQASGKVVQE